MKHRRLLILAGVAGAAAVPMAASAQAQTFPPGPGPVLVCGGTVGDCVHWAEHLIPAPAKMPM
jgi:hypothetical protein